MNQAIKPSPLGRGLSALFGDADASYQAKSSPAPQPSERGVRTLPVAWLQPGAFQPRRRFDPEAMQGLTASIRERGILEPLLVRPLLNTADSYEIIAGERRWRAAQDAGLHELPVIVRNLTDREALEFGLIENVQRQDLSPLEEAEGYKRLMEEFDHTQENLANVVGKSRPHITNMLRLLTLPKEVKQMIETGDLSAGHARALISARDQVVLAKDIVRRGLNVRQTEALVRAAQNRSNSPKKKASSDKLGNADVQALEKELERIVGLKIKIKSEGRSGSLTLYYTDLDQLDAVIQRLRS